MIRSAQYKIGYKKFMTACTLQIDWFVNSVTITIAVVAIVAAVKVRIEISSSS